MRKTLPFWAILIVLFFFSCKVQEPKVSSVYSAVLFDYENQSFPQKKLCVFVKPSSDFARVMFLEVISGDESLVWTVADPDLIKNEDSSEVWVGSANLFAGKRIGLPMGNYTAVYVDSASKSDSVSFSVSYNDAFSSIEYGALFSSNEYKSLSNEFTVVYDENQNILDFLVGDVKKDLIKEKYTKNAKKIAKRILKTSSNGKYGVLLPFEAIK